MNCGRCQSLSLDYVNNASGLELHQFKWLSSDLEIGDLDANWNHLVGYDAYDPNCALAHFTEDAPYFSEYDACDYAEEWFATHKRANSIIEHAESPGHQAPPLRQFSGTPKRHPRHNQPLD